MYKLVFEGFDGRLFSLTQGRAEHAVEYKINEWSFPQQGQGPLSVFKDMDSLREFQRVCWWRSCPVFEVKTLPTSHTTPWKIINGEKFEASESYYGARLVNAVKLIRRVA